jgi:hypothetical protein
MTHYLSRIALQMLIAGLIMLLGWTALEQD